MTTTPRDDAGRHIDRTMAAAILDRLDRGKTPIPGEAAVLRAVLTAEQADGDQAREQLAAAERDHNTRRVDLTQALGERMDIAWPDLLAAARMTCIAARDARQGEAEAVRAREAAETARGDALWTADQHGKHAERAEATLTAERLAQQRRIETSITAIRHAGLCADCEINLRAAIEAALGDPQPATETERCGQYGGHGEYCDYPCEPGSEQCAFHAAEARTHDAEPDDPCAHGCRQAADDLTRLGQEIDAEAEQPAEPEPDAPCFHPSWETEPTVGARKCTDCGEWLDPEPPAEPVGAALWATIRDHAARDHQFWTDLNRDWERQYRQGVRL